MPARLLIILFTVIATASRAVAQVQNLDQLEDQTAPEVGQVAHQTLTWLVGLMLLAAVLAIGFKRSKRTHLD